MEIKKTAVEEIKVEKKDDAKTGRKPLPIKHTRKVEELAFCMMANGVR